MKKKMIRTWSVRAVVELDTDLAKPTVKGFLGEYVKVKSGKFENIMDGHIVKVLEIEQGEREPYEGELEE